jgi:hypothetical protein
VGNAYSGVHRTVPSPETSACEARARAWLYVFECYERKNADAGSTAHTGRETKGEKDDRGENGTQGKKEIPPPSLTLLPRSDRGGSL